MGGWRSTRRLKSAQHDILDSLSCILSQTDNVIRFRHAVICLFFFTNVMRRGTITVKIFDYTVTVKSYVIPEHVVNEKQTIISSSIGYNKVIQSSVRLQFLVNV